MIEDQDKKLADKGWQSMQELLDREMPAEQKRRPFVWWWFGLLLLPLAILGSRVWWQSDPGLPTEPAPAVLKTERPVVQQVIENQPVAPEKAPVRSDNRPGIQSAKNADKTSVAARQLPADSIPQQVSVAQAPIRSSSASMQLPEVQTNTTTTSSPVENIAMANPSASETAAFLPDNATPANINHSDDADVATPLLPVALPFHAVETEQTRSLADTRTFAAIPGTNEASVKPLQTTPRWAFGLTSAVSTEQFSSLNSLSAGITTDWRFARKWGLRTSLLYTRYRPSASEQPVVAVDRVIYDKATGIYTGSYAPPITGGNTSTADLQEGYVYIPLRKLHQMEMPVMAWWQPVRPLRLYSGVSVNYTFLGQSAKQNFVENAIVSLDTNKSQRDAGQVATDELKRWQMNYQLGLGWRLGRHVELSAFWCSPVRKIFTRQNDLLASYNSATEQFSDISTTNSQLPRSGRFILQGSWFF